MESYMVIQDPGGLAEREPLVSVTALAAWSNGAYSMQKGETKDIPETLAAQLMAAGLVVETADGGLFVIEFNSHGGANVRAEEVLAAIKAKKTIVVKIERFFALADVQNLDEGYYSAITDMIIQGWTTENPVAPVGKVIHCGYTSDDGLFFESRYSFGLINDQ